MSDFTHERANSIIETSLTELAFIFFFILLIFSSWKISNISEQLDSRAEDKSELEAEIKELRESLESTSDFFSSQSNIAPEELFNELVLGRKAIKELEVTKIELQEATSSLNEIVNVSSSDDIDNIKREIREFQEAKEIVLNEGFTDSSLPEILQEIVKQHANVEGQNKNLRNKIEKLGNGLDHPPCWADKKTGAAQYVFSIIINEKYVEVLEGWPQSRTTEARSNTNIHSVIGKYTTNSELWKASNSLYRESVANDCRHIVRVFDHSQSKAAFKNYLLGIENHFYKFLSRDLYDR